MRQETDSTQIDRGWTSKPNQAKPSAIYARFADGTVMRKRRPLGAERFGWRLTWERLDGSQGQVSGWGHTEHSCRKCIEREKRKLWSGDHDANGEIVEALRGEIKAANDGNDRYLKVIYPPSHANEVWAYACRKGAKFLIVGETTRHYTVVILGDEYHVKKKELTIVGPWKGSPVFMKGF